MRLMPGAKLGAYEIVEAIGAGGMGELYRARDRRLGRDVAIKVLRRELAGDPERLRRFEQEARAASALNHPNIITIYDIGEHDSVCFIAMEYVQGKTLRELLVEGPIPTGRLLELATQIAEGLAKAHAAHIVHRDVKPENLMVSRDGFVKILDFGLAKLRPRSTNLDSEMATADRMDTHEGVVVGTAAYMSPEQAEGRELDARSDIFSFGSVLYEMATGQRAFSGESPLSTLSKILREEPKSLRELARATPPELEKIISRCLRKDPERRHQSAADLKVALQDVAQEWRLGSQRRLRGRWALAVLPALLVAGILAWRELRVAPSAEPMRAVALTTFPGPELRPTLSPGGDHVAFMWTGPKQDNPDIYVQQIDSAGSPLRVTTDPRTDYNPAWSPDGRWIAFLREVQAGMMGRELFLIPPLGGMERKLAEIQLRVYGTDDMPGFVGWCPDSTCVVVTDSPGEDMPDALVIVSLETGQKRQLTNPQRPLVGDTQPAISPDGRWLAFRRLPNPTAGELYLLPLGQGFTARGEPRRLTLMDLNAEHPAWMPDSKEILVSTGPRTAKALSRIAISGDNVAARIPFVGEDGQMPALSLPQMGRPVRLVYVRSFADANIWLVETRSPGGQAMSSPSVAIASTRNDIVGDFSPDGRHVVFASQRSGKQEIWRSDPDGSNPLQLTFATGSTAAAPRWSPKGESIVFQSNLQGQFDIHVVPSSGGKPRRITSDPATDVVPSFSRDGSWIYFSSNRTGDWQIWKVRSAGGDPVQVTRDSGFISRESLDGNHLYYMVPGSPAGLWRIPTAGGEPVKLLEGEIAENFDVVEKGIYYVDWLKGEARLQFFDFSSEKSAIVARNLGDVRPLLTATPDGRTILYTRLDSSGDDLMLVENFR